MPPSVLEVGCWPKRLMIRLEVGLGLGLWPTPVVLVELTLATRKEKIMMKSMMK